MSVTTRPITGADAAVLAELHAASWRVAYRGIIPDGFLDHGLLENRLAEWAARMRDFQPGHYGFIAEEDGQPVGFVFLRAAHDATWGTLLDNLHLRPERRGQGVGRLLVAAAARETARRAPDQGVYLWVFEENHKARRFYARIGGREAELAVRSHAGAAQVPEWRVVWDSPARLLSGATHQDRIPVSDAARARPAP